MSIVTLKKKVQAQYNNLSVGQPQFSLNGTRRSSGYVGQDMLGRSLVRSLSRNGALKGHGGCCGKYPTPQIKTSPEMMCLNNPAIVKSSSLNTNGLLMTKYRWIRRPQPYSVTKPNSYLNSNDQASYIDHIARKTILDSSGCNISGKVVPNSCCPLTKPANYNVNSITSWKNPNIIKPGVGAINASEHLRSLDKKCTSNDVFFYPKNTRGVPFACGTPNAFVPLFPNENTVLVPGLIDGTNGI
jgi:hypothetical protein